MPWGERQVVLLSGFALTQPIPGRAVWTKASGTLTFEAKGIPVETASGEACLLLLDLPEAGQYLLEDLDAGSARRAEGAVSGDLALSADSQRHYDLASFPIFQERLRLGLPSGSGPRVFLAFEAPSLPGEIESADLSFEREVIDEEPRKGGRKRRIVDTFEKGGKTFRSFRHTAIFQELPLEIR